MATVGIQTLVPAIAQLKSLVSLNLGHSHFHVVGSNEIAAEGAVALAFALKRLRGLEALNLSSNLRLLSIRVKRHLSQRHGGVGARTRVSADAHKTELVYQLLPS